MNQEITPKRIPRYFIVFECIAQKYNANTALVLGKIYNLEINGWYNEFRGSMDWLSRRCGLTRSTTSKIVHTLLDDNLLIDSTPEKLKNIKTSVKHYIVNTLELYSISDIMNDEVDEYISKDKLKNELKKELLLKSNSKKYNFSDMNVLEIDNIFQKIEYTNPFEDDE